MVSFSKKAVLAAPAFALILIFTTDTGNYYLRRLTTNCIRNIYATPTTILQIPEIPPNTNNNVPAYIALCQNLLNQEVGAYQFSGSSWSNSLTYTSADQNSVSITEIIHINEQAATCKDWSSPHSSIMDIISALIITRFTPLVRYRHNCDRTRVFDEVTTGFDHSTIQQVISTPTLGIQDGVGNATFIYQQCRRCLMYFSPQIEAARVGSKAHHHCFAWPQVATANTNVNNIPNLPSGSQISPLSMVIVPLVQRYYHAAVQFRAVTNKPPQEEQSGVIIYIDQYSLGLNYTTYLSYIPVGASSITVLTGPLCAKAYLSTGQLCATYGQGLASAIALKFPKLTTTGYNSGPGVVFQVAASTAGINSRLALAQLTICAPHTTSCYLPALSRVGGSSIVLEDPNWNKAIDFFTVAGDQGKVSVIVLDPSVIPKPVAVTLPSDASLFTASKRFTQVNVAVTDEGYPTNVVVPSMPTDAVISKTTDTGILSLINKKIGTFQSNPDVNAMVIESVPSMSLVQQALSAKTALSLNIQVPNGWGANGCIGELGLDSCLGLSKAIYNIDYMNIMNGFRYDSIIRIKHDYQEEAWYQRRSNRYGTDPSQIFEISCPVNAVATIKGYEAMGGTTFDNNNGRRMVAVDPRKFQFGANLNRICADAAAANAKK
jgi:3D (Asp-Asp-Asp) domain-containing protein